MAGTTGNPSFSTKTSPRSPVIYEGSLSLSSVCNTKSVVMTCQFNPTGSLIATGHSNGKISIWKPLTGNAVYELVFPQPHSLPATSVHFLGNYTSDPLKENILLATYASGYSCLWHITTGKLLSSKSEDGQSLTAAVSLEGATFCTSGSDGHLYVYDISTHELVTTLQSSHSTSIMDGHVNRVFSVCYHPNDPCQLISAGWDDTVLFWDIRQKHAVRKIFGPHISGEGLAINPITCNIITGSWRLRDTLELWDFNTGKLLKSLQPRVNTKVYAVRWIDQEYLLVGGSQQNKAIVVSSSRDLTTGGMIGLDCGVYGLDYTSANNSVAVASSNKLYLLSWKESIISKDGFLIPAR